MDTTFAKIVPILLITLLALVTSRNHTDVDVLQRNCQFDGNFLRFLLMLHTKAANGIYKSYLLGKSTFHGHQIWHGRQWPLPCLQFKLAIDLVRNGQFDPRRGR